MGEVSTTSLMKQVRRLEGRRRKAVDQLLSTGRALSLLPPFDLDAAVHKVDPKQLVRSDDAKPLGTGNSKVYLVEISDPMVVGLNGGNPLRLARKRVAATDSALREAETMKLHPAGRIATADEIAMAAVFMISDECRFMNAACLTVDGGLSVQQHQ